RAVRRTFGREPLHGGVGVLAQHADLASRRAQVLLELPGREPGVSLVQVAGDQIESHRGALLQPLQQVEQGERVLSARDTHQDAVPVLDQSEPLDGAAGLVEESLLEPDVGLSHAVALVTPQPWPGSTLGFRRTRRGRSTWTRRASTATRAGRWRRRSSAIPGASPTYCGNRRR